MHNNFNESKADNNFRSWLKERKCPDEIINDISKSCKSSKSLIIRQPDLFIVLLENGYGCDAIFYLFWGFHRHIFQYYNFIDRKDIAIELLKNKCSYHNIPLIRYFEDSKKFFNHKDFYIKLYKDVNPSLDLIAQGILKFFIVDCNEQQLKKCMSNQKLLNLLIENYLPRRILERIVQRDNYRTLNINNNKELMDLLLKEELIFSDNDYPNDKHRKELVTENKLIHNLLQINALKICDLLYLKGSAFESTAPDIRKKAEEVVESIKSTIKEIQAQSNLPNEHPAKGSELAEQVMRKLERNQDEVPSLMTLSVGAILNPQVEKIKAPQKKHITF